MDCTTLGSTTFAQQLVPPAASQTPAAAPVTPPATNSQAVATTGLLPIYGVELRVDKTWIDGANFPSQSTDFPNAGVNASFEQVWDALKPAGFNFVRIGFGVYDSPTAVNRAANICNWAKNNNVKVLLVLHGIGNGGSGDYASAAAAFVKTLAGTLKQDAFKAAYAQVAAYELEPDLNNPSLLRQISSQAKAQGLLTQTAQNVRTSETQALQGSGIDATPLVVRASFDYELMSAKAIAGTPLTDEAYTTAYSSLVQWLKPLATSTNIDLISIDWFPGTISAGGVDKPPVLLRSLATDIPRKQFLFTTGFSTAFHSDDEQRQYYLMTFANLGDLRASGGSSSPFLGVVFHEALSARSPAAPDSSLPQAVSNWDWPTKAGELGEMWTDQKKSDEMSSWLDTVQDNMGLFRAQADAFDLASLQPKAGMLALGQISSAVSSASGSVGSGQVATPVATAGTVPGQEVSTSATAAQAMSSQPISGAAMPGAAPSDQSMPIAATPAQAMPGQPMPGAGLALSPGIDTSVTRQPAF